MNQVKLSGLLSGGLTPHYELSQPEWSPARRFDTSLWTKSTWVVSCQEVWHLIMNQINLNGLLPRGLTSLIMNQVNLSGLLPGGLIPHYEPSKTEWSPARRFDTSLWTKSIWLVSCQEVWHLIMNQVNLNGLLPGLRKCDTSHYEPSKTEWSYQEVWNLSLWCKYNCGPVKRLGTSHYEPSQPEWSLTTRLDVCT